MEEKKTGVISNYFDKIGVAVVVMSDTINIGDHIHIRGAKVDFEQKVQSLQIEKKDVKQGIKGDSVGIKLDKPVRPGDFLYIVQE